MDALQSAIVSLRETLDKVGHIEDECAITQYHLITALLTRYGLQGWIDDLDICFQYLQDSENSMKMVLQNKVGSIAEAQNSVRHIQECRKSLNIDLINDILCSIEEATLASNGFTSENTELMILLGNTLIMRYLYNGETVELDRAATAYQEAQRSCANHHDTPFAYISLTLLAYVECLRFIECHHTESLAGLVDCMQGVTGAEKESGTSLLNTGLKLAEGATDTAQLQEAIELLSASLRHHIEPHPRRSSSLHHLASALLSRFQCLGNPTDLEDCIRLNRESLTLRSLYHPGRALSLKALSAATLERSRRFGTSKDLEESIILGRQCLELLPASHPDRPSSLLQLAASFLAQFLQHKNDSDLEEAINLCRESLSTMPPSHTDRYLSLSRLGAVLCTRFEHKGDFGDLEDSIALQREALNLRPERHLERSSLLNDLAKALFVRFEQKRVTQDLEECTKLHREALSLRPAPHPDRSWSLSNLANALCTHFKQKGSISDLEEGITLHREALALRPDTHPDRFMSLNNLATALSIHFDTKRELQDLDECITLRREAHKLLQNASRAYLSSSLYNLANSLATRFKQNGDLQDMEESISLHREALELRPAPHPNRSSSLYNLANALSTRFKKYQDAQDLDECIRLYREVLGLRLVNTKRSMLLNNLAHALFDLFERRGEVKDMEECIALHREALTLRPISNPERSASLNNLANALDSRYDRMGTFQDLEECILLQREALNLRPAPHPDRAQSLDNLGTALSARYLQKGSFQDIEECIVLHREGLHLRPVPHPDHCVSLNNLSNALFHSYRKKRIIQDLNECILLRQEALKSRPVPHPDSCLLLGNLGDALSLRAEHRGSSQDIDDCVALHREALRLRPQTSPSYPESLRKLANALCKRYLMESRSEDSEESISLLKQALSLQPALHPFRHITLHSLGNVFRQRFDCRKDDTDMKIALGYYEEASKFEPGSLLGRFTSSKNWATSAQTQQHASTIKAYQYAMELLPLLASLDLTLEQRQDVLENSRELVGNAAEFAIYAHQSEMAVMFLSSSRSIFWSQALQLRTSVDELKAAYPAVADNFIAISRKLECASHSGPESISKSDLSMTQSNENEYTSLHVLAEQRRHMIKEIQKLRGFEGFMLPPSLSSLKTGAKNGPIILLNASKRGCDALILTNETQPVKHVILSDIDSAYLEELKTLINSTRKRGARSVRVLQNPNNMTLQESSGRDMVLEEEEELNHMVSDLTISNQENFRTALKRLWIHVVYPVVEALKIQKTDSPERIWWCPTGPFTSLPLHAAGIYTVYDQPYDCLFQYAVSSYCTSPQDLLHPPPDVTQAFRITAIIEPEVPGAAFLPATRKELRVIEKHVPDRKDLGKRIGSQDAPNQVEDVLSDIQHSSFAHFGCHGMQNLKNPLESSLLLSGGKLTMSKIIRECKVAEGALAYLSACGTATVDELRPDESLNLVATMMFAGFRSVVGTMWSILDEDAPIVADVFYNYMFRHGGRAAPDVRDAAYGLHLATMKLREQGKPFSSWIPYVHYGI